MYGAPVQSTELIEGRVRRTQVGHRHAGPLAGGPDLIHPISQRLIKWAGESSGFLPTEPPEKAIFRNDGTILWSYHDRILGGELRIMVKRSHIGAPSRSANQGLQEEDEDDHLVL